MNFKKILALVLVVAMCLSMVPTYAFADDVELWDEEDVAVQNDAPLEDEYIDEDPVTQEPAEEEPAATDPEEPAAEEPAAEEPAPAAEAAAPEQTALNNIEKLDFEAGEVAFVTSTSKMYGTVTEAVEAAIDGDTITMLNNASDATVYIQKSLTIQAADPTKIAENITLISGTLTLQNGKTTTISVGGGKLSIAAGDTGSYGTVTAASSVTSGDVKGGYFTAIDAVLLAEGYAPTNYDGTTALSGSIVGVDSNNPLKKFDFVATRVDADGNKYYFTKATIANAFKAAGTVTLTANIVDLENFIPVTADVTLVMNGKTISCKTGIKTAFRITSNATLTVTGDSTSAITGTIMAGYSGNDNGNLVLNGGTYSANIADECALQNNGECNNSNITLNGVTLNSTDDTIYFAGSGTLKIENSTINGYTGIYMKAGKLDMKNTTINATGPAADPKPNGNGASSTGDGIIIDAKQGYMGNVEIKLGAGNIINSSKAYAFHETYTDSTATAVHSIEITDGEFNSATGKEAIKASKYFDQAIAAKTASIAISGGKFSTIFPDTYCAEGFIPVKNDDGTYGVDNGTYVARVADMVQKNVDYTTLGQGYTTLDEAIAAAKAPVEEGKPEHVLVILNKVKPTDKIALNDGEKINIWYKAGIALADRYAEENFEVGEYVKVEEILPAQYYVHTWAATGYLALVSTKGSTADPDKFMTLDGDTGAVKAAYKDNSKVLKVLKATETDITLNSENDFINIDETDGKNVSVKAAAGLVAVPNGEGIVKYVAKKAVASYVDADGNDVYTMTFAKAATEGAENADYEGNFTVTLYQAPDFDANDVYALGANYTMTVVATPTDTSVRTNLEAKVGNYNAPLYKLMVTNDGEVAVAATHTTGEDNFVYTAMTPVAKAPLNTAEVTYQYFATVNEAIKFVVEEHYNDNLYLIPMADGVFTVTKDQIDTADADKSYWGKDIRIDNSGEKKIRLADAQDPAENPTRFWTYSVNAEASTENYTSYTLKDATVKIPAKPEMNIYYDVVPGTNTKFFPSFADAVAADSTAVIELIATPTDAQKQYTTETFELGIPGGPISVKAKLNGFNWLKVDPFSDDQAVVGNTDKDGITTYTLSGAVASITTGTGAQAETVKYSTFKEAADLATNTELTVKLLATISEKYELANGATLKVNKNTFDVKVVAAGEEPTYAIVETTDKKGITTYESVAPVARINFGTEDEPNYTLYGTFAEAAKAAFTPAGTDPTLEIELMQNPSDKYEVTAAGSFLVDISNATQATIVSTNLSFAKDAPVVQPATAKPISGNHYQIIVEAAVATANLGTEAKPNVKFYGTFAEAAQECSNTTLEGAVTITLLANVEDTFKQNTSHFMKVEKGEFNLTVEANNASSASIAYAIDDVLDPETGITSYSPVKAAASIGTATDIKYFKDFATAATASEGTKTITLYNTSETASATTYTYTLGAEGNVSTLIVNKNGQTLNVSSGVTGKEVIETQKGLATTYELGDSVAYIKDGELILNHYGNLDKAISAGEFASDKTSTKVIVLEAAVKSNIQIDPGMQINLQAGSYLGENDVVVKNTVTDKKYFVVPTPNGDVTNYKSVEAVASVKFAGATEPTYFTTFADAAKEAYVTGDTPATLTVVIYKQPVTTGEKADLFQVTTTGSILVDQSFSDATKAAVLKPNFDLAEGLVYLPESAGKADVYLVKVAEAEAYTIRNNGKYDYYATVTEACDFSAEQTSHPVVYLQKNELSYALAKGDTIRVDKNGHDDFIVTKATPTDVEPSYAIVETVSGTVSTYETSDDFIGYIDFDKEVQTDDSYGVETQHNYVYYTNMADASQDAKGTKTIVLTATMTDVQRYMLTTGESIIIDKTEKGYEPKLTVREGSALKITPSKTSATVFTYSVETCVALVTANFTPVATTTKAYASLDEALADAVAFFDKDAVIELTAAVPEGYTFALGELDWVRMAKQTATLSLTESNFTVPGGMFAEFTPDGDFTVVKPAKLLASVGEGEKIQYFATFTDAVAAAVAVESASGHYGDVNNPKSVITLYADNKVEYLLDSNDGTGNVESLRIKAGEHKTGLKAPDDYFVEEIPENEEGVSLYKLSKIVASVESGPNNDRVTTYYSSFAAAATAAHNTVESVVLQIPQADLDSEDIYELPVGTLQVYLNSNVTNFANLQKDHIKAKGEKTFINSEWISDGHYQLFTVSGAVASITTPRGTSFYYNMFNAIKAAINNTNLVIVPLTDIDYYMTTSEVSTLGVTTVPGSKFNVADSEYDVNLRAEGYELVEKDNIYTFTDAVAFVVTDDVYAVDPATNKPTYIKQYFATIDDAIDFADGEKTITLLADVSYKFEDVDTVAIIATNTDVHAFNYTLDEELTDDYAVKVTPAPNIAKYEVAGLEAIRFDAGEGGQFGATTPATTYMDAIGYEGQDVKGQIQQIPFPTRPGYHIDSWTGSDGKTYEQNDTGDWAWVATKDGQYAIPTEVPEGGLTLTADWSANLYWIDYARNDNGTKVILDSTKLTYGELLEVPEGVTAVEHYDFAGWFTDLACTPANAFDIAKTPITADLKLIDNIDKPAVTKNWESPQGFMTLYGKFVPKQYTVSFDTGCDVVIPDQPVVYNNPVEKPADNLLNGKRVGYTFAGTWHYLDASGNPVAWNFNDPISGNITLIADWNPNQLAITWADGSFVIRQDALKNVGTPTDAPSYDSRTNPGYRIDPDKAWIDDEGELFTGTVPVKNADQWIYRLNWIEQVSVTFADGGKMIGQITVDKGTALADAENVPAPTKEGYTLVWQLEGEDYDVKAPIQEDMLLTASWVEGSDVTGYATVVHSLSLENNINMNAYVTIKEDTLPSDYEITVTFNGETSMTGTLEDLGEFKNGEYKLTNIAQIAAPQMNDPATVTITYQGKEVLTKDLSVRGYAEEWIEKSSDAELVDLLKALLDFGAYSQKQFNYQTDNLVNSKYTTGRVPNTTVPVYPVKIDGTVASIKGASTSLTLVSNTALNVYFSVDGKDDYKFTVDSQPAEKVSYSNKEYKVSVENIVVANLAEEHVFTATLDGETYTVTAAPLAYAYEHQGEDALGNVCKAVYVYYLAADAFFG